MSTTDPPPETPKTPPPPESSDEPPRPKIQRPNQPSRTFFDENASALQELLDEFAELKQHLGWTPKSKLGKTPQPSPPTPSTSNQPPEPQKPKPAANFLDEFAEFWGESP